MKNNYIYAALGLLALFLISKNKRDEVNETRDSSEKADSEKGSETGVPTGDDKITYDVIDFKQYKDVVL